MATIRCKSCGRVYSYEKNGTCPKCGAYNRPPRKEIVEADGSVHYVTTESKVCYEEEECYEDEVRQSTGSYSYTPEKPVGVAKSDRKNNAAKTLWQHRNAIATAGKQKKLVAVLAIISAVCSLFGVLMSNLGNRHGVSVQEPWESVSVESAQEICNLLAHVGNVVYTDSGAFSITSYEQADSELKIDLQTISKTDASAFDNLTLNCYYETPTDQAYLEMDPLFSDGERYTFVATLPEDITASDCAVLLDIPFAYGINRYWVWLEPPTYAMGEDFYLGGQRLFVTDCRQSHGAVDVSIDCEWGALDGCDASLTALNVNDQPYIAAWQTIKMTDGQNTSLVNFSLRNANDTAQSITLRDRETQRQVIVYLQ